LNNNDRKIEKAKTPLERYDIINQSVQVINTTAAATALVVVMTAAEVIAAAGT